jgi:hypothetical protein
VLKTQARLNVRTFFSLMKVDSAFDVLQQLDWAAKLEEVGT